MKKVRFSHTNVETSRLGFGCVQLTVHSHQREAIAVLERAFSLGITHFDTARAYGFGRAEGILREFLRHKRDSVTVTTKFGIEPPAGLVGNVRLINILKKILGPFPALLHKAKNRGSSMVKAGSFTPEAAQRSLETSLRELGTDYIDVFLLHEGTLCDATSEPLMEMLRTQVEKGKIRHFGVGSDFRKFQGDADRWPSAYEVLQFDDNALEQNVGRLSNRGNRFLVTHSIFSPLKALRRAMNGQPRLVRDYGRRMNIDLSEPSAISSLLLQFALWSNAHGIVLFSSTDREHIAANVSAEQSASAADDQAMQQFVAFVDELMAAVGILVPQKRSASRLA